MDDVNPNEATDLNKTSNTNEATDINNAPNTNSSMNNSFNSQVPPQQNGQQYQYSQVPPQQNGQQYQYNQIPPQQNGQQQYQYNQVPPQQNGQQQYQYNQIPPNQNGQQYGYTNYNMRPPVIKKPPVCGIIALVLTFITIIIAIFLPIVGIILSLIILGLGIASLVRKEKMIAMPIVAILLSISIFFFSTGATIVRMVDWEGIFGTYDDSYDESADEGSEDFFSAFTEDDFSLDEWADESEEYGTNEEEDYGTDGEEEYGTSYGENDAFTNRVFQMEDGSTLYLEADGYYYWYRDEAVMDDNYYIGTYAVYNGTAAEGFLFNDLYDYGLTEEDLTAYYEGNVGSDLYIPDNLYCLVLYCDYKVVSGVETAEEGAMTPYFGFSDGISYDIANMNTGNYMTITDSSYIVDGDW